MVPAPVAQRLGLKARMRVTGEIDGVPFRSSLMPRGGGRLFVVVPSALRERIAKTSGQSVDVALVLDRTAVVVRVPADFRVALGDLRPNFDKLAPSHRKAFVQWISSAKMDATRQRRISKAVEMMRLGQTLN
jgi:bifunctional DNA-binding transcriptional regulator/antitoxin component of YhaV-PrlF toxin-antitoxin module